MCAFFITILSSLGIFNYFIDPYDLFGLPEKRRPIDLVDLSHITKAVQLIHNKRETMIIGSSIVDAGFKLPGSMTVYHQDDFAQKMADLQARLPANTHVYNAGIRGGGMSDIYHYIQHAIKNNPELKHIIIGLEWNLFGNMRRASKLVPETEPLGKTQVPFHFYANNLFSFGVTYDAARTFSGLMQNRLHDLHMWAKQHGVDITKPINYMNSEYQRLHYKAQNQLSPQNIPYNVIPNPVVQGKSLHDMPSLMFTIWQISAVKDLLKRNGDLALVDDQAWQDLRRIVALAKENNIQLDVYVSPQHACFWETMKRFGMEDYNYLWLKKLAEITPFWDFSERIDFSPEVDNYFDTDALHFNSNAGEIILPAIMSHKGQGLRFVTTENIDELIHNRKLAQEKWLNGNPYLKDIYDHKTFMQAESVRGDLEKISMTRLMPVINGYQIIKFMDKYMALPQSDKPYDFRLLFLDQYPGTLHGNSVKELETRLMHIENSHS